ncbi:MAG: hypothetical protein AAFO07_29020 [Bacteroidota bacterium]
MEPRHRKDLDLLIELLEELSDVFGAHAEFVRIFNKKTGKTVPRNTANKIIRGNVNFTGSLNEFLGTAIIIAQLIKEKTCNNAVIPEKDLAFSDLKLYESVSLLENQILLIDSLYKEGAFQNANTLLRSIESAGRLYPLRSQKPYIYALFCFLCAKMETTLGVPFTRKAPLFYINESIKGFKELNEIPNLLKAFDVLRISLRQENQNMFAVRQLKEDLDILSSKTLSSDVRKHNEMKILHQNAISLFKEAKNHPKAEALLIESGELFRKSNEYFKHGHNENWYRHVEIREAELLVKSNQFHKADSILSKYENVWEFAMLTDTQKAIFLRINCEKYLKVEDSLSAFKFFKAAVDLCLNKGLKGELRRLDALKNAYPSLHNHLPPKFSVFDPIWE